MPVTQTKEVSFKRDKPKAVSSFIFVRKAGKIHDNTQTNITTKASILLKIASSPSFI
jgi:hypothetical protein